MEAMAFDGSGHLCKNARRPRHSANHGTSVHYRVVLSFCLSAAVLLAACGYGVGGRATRLPPGIKVIAIPTLENRTNRYRIEQLLTEAVIHEFLARTKYRIVSTEAGADAVLRGQITSIESAPVVFDTSTNPGTNTSSARATTMLVTVTVSVRLVQPGNGEVLYRNDNFLFREPYEISTDVPSFFDEQGTALERMARDFASRLVAAVLENF
jgi:curli biogenesis system outer membrane secretion channel CsgG